MSSVTTGLMFDDFSRCGSPIEALLQLAMAAASHCERFEWCDARSDVALRRAAQTPNEHRIIVASQVWLSRTRSDFAFAKCGPFPTVYGVECDGKEFHGRPEQKSRDRYRDVIQFQGRRTKTIRLPGSRIYRDPIGALSECLEGLGHFPVPLSARRRLTEDHKQLAMQAPLNVAALSHAARMLGASSGLLPTHSLPQANVYSRAYLAQTDFMKGIGQWARPAEGEQP